MNDFRRKLRRSAARKVGNPLAKQLLLGETADDRLFGLLPRPEGLVDTSVHKQQLPQIDISFYLGVHKNASDARQMEPYINGMHAVSFEFLGVPPEEATRLEVYNMLGLDLSQHPVLVQALSNMPGDRGFIEDELRLLREKEKALCLVERTRKENIEPLWQVFLEMFKYGNEMVSGFGKAQLEEVKKICHDQILSAACNVYMRDDQAAMNIRRINNLLLRQFLGLSELPEIKYLISIGAGHKGLVQLAEQAVEEVGLRNVTVDVAYDAGAVSQDMSLILVRTAADFVRKNLGPYRGGAVPRQHIQLPFTHDELESYLVYNTYTSG